MKNKQVYVIAIIFIIFIALIILYKWFIKKYTLKNNIISYDYFIKLIRVVDPSTHLMNYGLWDTEHNTLSKATINLINFIFNKADLKKTDTNILDIGCGYGEQDMELAKMIDDTSTITAVDISDKQIAWANKNCSRKNIKFDSCDAMEVDKKYDKEIFDTIFSIESAFHYNSRPKFFKNVNFLLKDTGTFVIADIALREPYNKTPILSSIFIKIFSDFFHIPKQNLISTEEWLNQLSNELKIVEIIDITEKTFKPHYRHWVKTYFENKNLPLFLADIFIKLLISIQPFTYTVAVCKKS